MHSNEGRTTVYYGSILVNQLIYLWVKAKNKKDWARVRSVSGTTMWLWVRTIHNH